MWGQTNSKFAAAVSVQLLAKIHLLSSKVEDASHIQNHLVNCPLEHIDFIGETSNRVGGVVDKLNSHIDAQDIQIDQLANMVNNLVGKVEGQAKQLKEEHQ